MLTRPARRVALRTCVFGLTLSLLGGGLAQAAVITDPLGDFIPSYVGPKNGDLDALTTEAIYDGVNFTIKAHTNGSIGATAGGLYVWGFQRGQGTPRFAAIAPGVVFDAVLSFTPGGVTSVRDLVTGAATTLPAGAVVINGNDVTITFPAALLPSQGLTPGRFQFNLWPRSGGANNNQIADFAPDNSDALFTLAFPSPVTAASAQSDLAIDNASFAFERISGRLGAQRGGAEGAKGGAFVVAGGRSGSTGLSGSALNHTSSTEITAGLDFAFTPGLVVGVAASTSHSLAKTAPLDSRLKSDAASGYVFGGWSGGPFYVDLFAGYSNLEFTSHRRIPIGATAFDGYAEPKGWTVSYGGRAGYQMQAGGLTWGPVVDLIHTRATLKRYAEAGAGDFGAIVEGRKRDSDRLGVGVDLAKSTTTDWGVLKAHLLSRLVFELGDRRDDVAFAFVPQPNVMFGASSPKITGTYAAFDLGIETQFKNGAAVGLTYAPRVDKDGVVDNAAFLTARIGF